MALLEGADLALLFSYDAKLAPNIMQICICPNWQQKSELSAPHCKKIMQIRYNKGARTKMHKYQLEVGQYSRLKTK